MNEEERKANKERFLALVDRHDPSFLRELNWRVRNRWWLRHWRNIQLRYYIIKDSILESLKR